MPRAGPALKILTFFPRLDNTENKRKVMSFHIFALLGKKILKKRLRNRKIFSGPELRIPLKESFDEDDGSAQNQLAP